jgi:LacI family transcriptional regulator
MGALARLRAGGLAVPADIALAGFDDIGTLRDVYPPLTTVRLPLKRMGEMAAGLVLAEPPGTAPEPPGTAPEPAGPAPGPRPRVVPVPGEVILRDSTLPHPRRLSPGTP